MANEITRLLPFRQYDDNDVINFYSLDAETGEAGSVVRVSSANLDTEPIKYVERGLIATLGTLRWATDFPCIP